VSSKRANLCGVLYIGRFALFEDDCSKIWLQLKPHVSAPYMGLTMFAPFGDISYNM
jgi:hypothetical protein